MIIKYDGSNAQEIRAAADALKPKQTIRIGGTAEDGTLRLDGVWPDGQVSPGRWHLRVGDSFDTETGATYSNDEPVDDAEVFGVGVSD